MTNVLQNIHIARVSTIPLHVLTLLRTQLDSISEAGANLTVITSEDESYCLLSQIKDCKFKSVSIARDIKLIGDLVTLVRLTKIFRAERYDIVHSTTPKAGLLCAIAAKFAGVPIRLHTFTGQAWITMRGIKKYVVRFCDKIIGFLNTHCYADSASQRNFLINNNIINQINISVLGKGSIAGVNIKRYCLDNFSLHNKETIRSSVNIGKDDMVLLFIGRITRDKGIFELIDAMSALIINNHTLKLLIVGPWEQNLESEIRAYAKRSCGDKVIFTGHCSKPENFIAIASILCLPSYREGFGTVVIEAAAMGVPAIATRIYGLTDAVVDEVTGILIEPRDVLQLTTALDRLISNNKLRTSMGENAKQRVVDEFDSKVCGKLLVEEYLKLIIHYGRN